MAKENRPPVKNPADMEVSEIVALIEELGTRCESLEGSNAYLAAQLKETGKAWRDAIAHIAATAPESAAIQADAIRSEAAAASGLRQQVFAEMGDILAGKRPE